MIVPYETNMLTFPHQPPKNFNLFLQAQYYLDSPGLMCVVQLQPSVNNNVDILYMISL